MTKISNLAGTSYKVQYQPEFSASFIKAIKDNVTPSMVNNPDDSDESGLYAIDQVIEFVSEVKDDEDLMAIHGFTQQDLALYNYIKNSLQVGYIEV